MDQTRRGMANQMAHEVEQVTPGRVLSEMETLHQLTPSSP